MTAEELRPEFDRRYSAWTQRQMTTEDLLRGDPLLSQSGARTYWHLMDLGLPALPLIMEKMDAGDLWLARGANRMIKRRFHVSEYADRADLGDAWTIARMLIAWWQQGRAGTENRFRELRARWRELKSPEKTPVWTSRTHVNDRGYLYTLRTAFTPAGEVYDGLQCLGIAVLPHIVETLKEGEADFLPIALELTDGAGGLGDPTRPPEVAAFLEWWEANKQDWLIPWPEEPAGP